MGDSFILRSQEVDFWNLRLNLCKKRFGLIISFRFEMRPILYKGNTKKCPEVGDSFVLRSREVDFWNLRLNLYKKRFGLLIFFRFEMQYIFCGVIYVLHEGNHLKVAGSGCSVHFEKSGGRFLESTF